MLDAERRVPRNITEKNSVCFLSIILHEHDFLPQFIEHHVMCGISQFIFLVTEYGLREPQEEYLIPDEYKHIVTLIRITDELFTEEDKEQYYAKCRKAAFPGKKYKLTKYDFCPEGFISFAINKYGLGSGLIKTEWILATGIDQYLNITCDKSLPEYLNTLNERVNQVFIPWGAEMFNPTFQMADSFSEIINEEHTSAYLRACVAGEFPNLSYNNKRNQLIVPTNGLVKTKDCVGLAGNTHIFYTNPVPESCFHCLDMEYDAARFLHKHGYDPNPFWAHLSLKIQELLNGKTNLSVLPIYTVHFRLRGFTELIVGNLLWHFVKPQYDLFDKRYDPWRHYAEFIKKYFEDKSISSNMEKINDGNLYDLFMKLGNREDPRIGSFTYGPHTERALFHATHEKYPLKNMQISNWKYKYKITTFYYDNLIYNELKRYDIKKEQMLEIFNINLKLRNLPPISEEVKNASGRIWFDELGPKPKTKEKQKSKPASNLILTMSGRRKKGKHMAIIND